MPSLSERWEKIWGYIQGSPAEVVRSIAIPSEHLFHSGASQRFEPGKQYFSVLINEMFLTHSRQWFDVYDPMALVVSEFTYGGKRTTVPFVVGPSLLEGKLQKVPGGITITDTQVAGAHPYQGGRFAFTVVLAQVKRSSYAKRLLQVIENVASVFPVGAALEPHLKVAGAVMDGIESLFGMGETTTLAGHRWEYNDGFTPWLEPGFFALINADEMTHEAEKLSVVKGRLRHGIGEGAPSFRMEDFLLYSLCCIDNRTDIAELPIYRMFESALRQAASIEEGSWDRAKAALVTLYQEMLTSPDLTWEQVRMIAQSFQDRLVEAHERAKSFAVLTGDKKDVQTAPRSVGITFAGPDADARLVKLREIHQLLSL